MAKHDLHVAVPALFRCPISLEVMKSPVALSTGISYDRSSIQPWLDAGNLTCPATMLPLPSPRLVPNLSLHRLIRLWSLSLPTSPPLLLIHRLTTTTNPNQLSLHLSSVRDSITNSEEDRDVFVNSDRFLRSIGECLCSGEKEVSEIAIRVLDLMLRDSDKPKAHVPKLESTSIGSVLRTGETESRVAAARVVGAIGEARGLVGDLYGLVVSDDDSLIEAGLSALISVMGTRSVRSEVVRLGIVKVLGDVMSGDGHTDAVVGKGMEMAEVVATCSVGRLAICEDEKVVAEIVKRLMKVSEKGTESGVTVLWSVCYLFRNKKAVAAAVGSNGLGKCLLVMQSKCSAIVRRMCCDLVKVLRVDSAGLTSYHTKTTHIMAC